ENVDPQDPTSGNWRAVVRDGVLAVLPEGTPGNLRARQQILTNNTQFFVRDAILADPSVIGKTLTLSVPASDPYDQLNKGVIKRDTPPENRRLSDEQIAWFDQLVAQGRVATPFNWGLFFNAD